MEEKKKLVLTWDQAAADRAIFDFLRSDHREFSLRGHAGTGKTTLVNHVLGHLFEAKIRSGDVVCAAPTNKAAQVLRGMVQPDRTNGVMTLHSLIGMRLVTDWQTGKESFVVDRKRPPMTCRLVVADEGSMISEELHNLVMEKLIAGAKVIWIGDPSQLPPVGETESPTLKCSRMYEMREIVRHGGAIQNLSNQARDAVISGAPLDPESDFSGEEDEGVHVLGKEEWLARMKEDMSSERGRNDPNFARAMAWTNKVVDWGNDALHRFVHGQDAEEIMPGQILVARSTITIDRQVLLNTSDEVRVVKVDKDEVDGVPTWLVFFEIIQGGSPMTMQVVRREGRAHHKWKVGELRDTAIRLMYDHKAQSEAWKRFYRYTEMFADLAPCYWTTVHKAQGSTFQKAYVCLSDINRNSNPDERNRMVYTAATRAAKQVLITK